MADIVKHSVSLPADFGANLMQGIEKTRSTINAAGGKMFMRLTKGGVFIYGQEDTEVQEGSLWAVNLASLQHGWVCWDKGELLGQIMTSVLEDAPPRPPSIEGVPFVQQWGMEMACINGEDAGVEVVYKNNSNGFKKGFDALLVDIRARYPVDAQFYWPVVRLSSTNYQSKQWGKIWEPHFSVASWADAQGNLQSAAPRAVETPAAATPPRRRAAVVTEEAAELQAAMTPPPAEDAPAAPVARQGQRRRPAAR